MKKMLLLTALAIAGVFTSCSDDNASTNDAQDTSLELLKTVKYIPTKQAYDSNVEGSKKNVQYFEGHKVVADTTFDPSGSIAMRIVHTYTANTHNEQILVNELPWIAYTYAFDNTGRIIEKRSEIYLNPNSSVSIIKYVYNTNSITVNHYDPGTNQLMPQYTILLTVNSEGLIDSWIDSSNGIVYENDKPVQMNDATTAHLEYYDMAMPTNMTKSVNEFNNLFFESDDYRIGMAENNNYYLKKYTFPEMPIGYQVVTFDKTFNEHGYVTYSKAVGSAYEDLRDSETFYYYE